MGGTSISQFYHPALSTLAPNDVAIIWWIKWHAFNGSSIVYINLVHYEQQFQHLFCFLIQYTIAEIRSVWRVLYSTKCFVKCCSIWPADAVTFDFTTTGWPLLYLYIPYTLGPIGYSDVSYVFEVGCVGGGMDSDKVIQGWQSDLEWSTQTLWGDLPFQILFDDIASPQTPPPPPHSPNPSSSPSPTHTRHHSRQHLHISQQINSVEHNPYRELSNALCGPPSPSPSSVLPPIQQFVQLKPASRSSFTDSCHFPNSLSRPPHRHATVHEPH